MLAASELDAPAEFTAATPSLPTSSYPQLGLILALLRSLLAAPLIAGIVPSTGIFAAVPAMAAVSRSLAAKLLVE